MADFIQAYDITMKIEGGYSNNPFDKGGETYKGISRKFHPEWSGWITVDKYHSENIHLMNDQLNNDTNLQILVKDFYKKEYWDTLSLNNVVEQKIAQELFDTAINMGIGVASVFLQRSLNVTNRNGKDYTDLKIDGKIGPKTLAILNYHPRPKDVLKTLNVLQGEKYIAICEANPAQEIFFSGWLNRVFEN